MIQQDLFNNIDRKSARFTKTWCSVCGNGWGDENFFLGLCCGRDLIFDHPMTQEEILQELKREKLTAAILKRASKLGW